MRGKFVVSCCAVAIVVVLVGSVVGVVDGSGDDGSGGYCCVVAAYRQSPTRKYLLAWLSSEPGLSACGILYRTRGFPHSRSMRERTNKKREICFVFCG